MKLQHDDLILIYSGLAVLVMAVLTEWLSRRKLVAQWLSRKWLHTFSVGMCAIMPYLLFNTSMLLPIVAVAEILLIVLVATGVLFKEDGGRKSWGIALFPLPYLYLLWVFPMHRWLIFLPMAILAISDSIAAIVGKLTARKFYQLTGDPKSINGSVAFFIATCVILYAAVYLPLIPKNFKQDNYLYVIPLFAFLITLSEAMGSKGNDNLFVPISAMVLLQFVYVGDIQMFTALALPVCGLLFLWGSVRLKLLDLSGAVAAVILGSTVVLFSGWIWLLPLAFFLLSSSLISRIPFLKGKGKATKAGRPRDWKQVFCNGAVYGILSTVYSLSPAVYQSDMYLLMLVSMAVATSDTWASEIGVGFRGKVIDLVSFKKVEAGMSGGVSFAGTIAALVGATAIAALSFILLPFMHQPLNAFLFTTVAGFSGMMLDSLLGALLQGKYLSNTGDLLDFKSKESRLFKGFDSIDNDSVNLISQLIILGFAFLYLISA
jgi:uncharacterized protein (TIGR00297 family)